MINFIRPPQVANKCRSVELAVGSGRPMARRSHPHGVAGGN